MDRPIVALVPAGGTGTRLYPASRSDSPKQFHAFGGDQSLLAETVARAGFADEIYVLTRPELADAAREHAPGAAVLTEPEPKDTGPALLYGTHRIREQVGECVIVCLPSDHHVAGDFAATMERAAAVTTETGDLVTVGVEPTRPETGYGYIKPGEERVARGHDYYAVEKFTEKPDQGAAMRYRHHGYYWNAGMFAWTPDALFRKATGTDLGPLVDALDAGDPETGFAAVDSISIDYAVMEATDRAALVPATFEWDDLGAWDALGRVRNADTDGNVTLGDAITIDTSDTVIATDGHVSAVNVEGLAIASYGDRTLVLPKSASQRVREVVSELREQDEF